MSLDAQTSQTELISTSGKLDSGCNLTCTTGYPTADLHPIKSILKKNHCPTVVPTTSRKELGWSDTYGGSLHEVREYIVSEIDDEEELDDEEEEEEKTKKQFRRKTPSCCLVM